MQFIKLKFQVLAGLFALGAAGCASDKIYVPSLDRQFEPMPEFTSRKSVALANQQPSTQLIQYASANKDHWPANLHDWTDAPNGHRVSVIHGALPPKVRRREAERFAQGESHILVAPTPSAWA